MDWNALDELLNHIEHLIGLIARLAQAYAALRRRRPKR